MFDSIFLGLIDEGFTVESEMSSQRQLVTAHDLLEEEKQRIVILSICFFGLSCLMSCL